MAKRKGKYQRRTEPEWKYNSPSYRLVIDLAFLSNSENGVHIRINMHFFDDWAIFTFDVDGRLILTTFLDVAHGVERFRCILWGAGYLDSGSPGLSHTALPRGLSGGKVKVV